MNNPGSLETPRYIRRPEYDRRIRRGADFVGDAWEDTRQTGQADGWGAMLIVYTMAGHDLSQSVCDRQPNPRQRGEDEPNH